MNALLPRTYDNPFCTSRVRPGAIPFRFPAGESTETILARWQRAGRCGAIIGPHGSGKSTLLAPLTDALQAAGDKVVSHTLHDGDRNLPIVVWTNLRHAGAAEPTTLIIDGYEQLSRWEKWRVSHHCRRAAIGLFITAHSETRLPTLLHTSISETLLSDLVAELLVGFPPLVTPADLRRAYSQHSGNLRESLFALYDTYESRK